MIVAVFSAVLVRLERTTVGRVWAEVWVRVVSIEREVVVPLVEGIEVVKWFGIRVRFRGCIWWRKSAGRVNCAVGLRAGVYRLDHWGAGELQGTWSEKLAGPEKSREKRCWTHTKAPPKNLAVCRTTLCAIVVLTLQLSLPVTQLLLPPKPALEHVRTSTSVGTAPAAISYHGTKK